jgi:hypothetical protein
MEIVLQAQLRYMDILCSRDALVLIDPKHTPTI